MARYVDAEELLKNLPNDLPYKGSVRRVLIQAPTADVDEVKHGRWIVCSKSMFGYNYRCSICSTYADEDNKGCNAILTNYCSRCGAKMDGGKAE